MISHTPPHPTQTDSTSKSSLGLGPRPNKGLESLKIVHIEPRSLITRRSHPLCSGISTMTLNTPVRLGKTLGYPWTGSRNSVIFRMNISIIFIWLVVSTPLKNISQLGSLFPIYGKKHVPNHQPVIHYLSICNCSTTNLWVIWVVGFPKGFMMSIPIELD